MDEYINSFGLDKRTEEMLKLKKRIVELTRERIVKKDRFLDNKINMLKTKLEAQAIAKGVETSEIISFLEAKFGFPMDKITVYEFYRRLKSISNGTSKKD